MSNSEVSKNSATKLGTKTFALLLAVLGINTLRYGIYLLESSSTSVYYWGMFALNLFSLIIVVILKTKTKAIDLKSD